MPTDRTRDIVTTYGQGCTETVSPPPCVAGTSILALEVLAHLAAVREQQPAYARLGRPHAARLFGAPAALRDTFGASLLAIYQDHYDEVLPSHALNSTRPPGKRNGPRGGR